MNAEIIARLLMVLTGFVLAMLGVITFVHSGDHKMLGILISFAGVVSMFGGYQIMPRLCQGPDCHTYDTTDRKRGPKGNKRNETRKIGQYGYGNNNFCTLNCQNDWWALHGNQAVDYFGRLFQPKVLTAENGWRQVFNRAHWDDDNAPQYIERNMLTGEERPHEERG